MGIAAEVEACLCGDIQAMLKQRDQERDKIMDKDWAQLRASNIKEAKRTEQEQRQADVANSRYITEPDPPQYPETDTNNAKEEDQDPKAKGHIYQKFDGLFTYAWDAVKSTEWDLFTHGGFLTYVHHDASGFCTYVFVRCGCKIWVVLRPKITKDISDRTSFLGLLRRILRPYGKLDYKQHTDLYTVFLMEGDLL